MIAGRAGLAGRAKLARQAKRPGQARRAGRTYGAGFLLLTMLAAFVVVLPIDLSAQCAMCRTLLKTPEGQQMVSALRSGIVLLLAAPFSIFAVVATLAVRSQRRRERSS